MKIIDVQSSPRTLSVGEKITVKFAVDMEFLDFPFEFPVDFTPPYKSMEEKNSVRN